VLDASNRIYVIDKLGALRRTISGPGRDPGLLRSPCGVAASADGQSIFVADTGNGRVQKFRTADGQVRAIAGGPARLTPGGFTPKNFGLQSLSQPYGIAVHEERLFVSDTWNHRIVVLSTSPASTTNLPRVAATDMQAEYIAELPMLAYFGSKGRAPGSLQFPKGLAVAPGYDEAGEETAAPELIVADSRNHRIQCFTLDGKFTRGVSGGGNKEQNEHPGRMGASDLFSFPTNVCISAPLSGARYVFVADQRAITIVEHSHLQPVCIIALSNPARTCSARPTTCTAVALCSHALPHRSGPLPLYVAEYDEHAVREVLLTRDDLRSDRIDASSARNVLEVKHSPLGWALPKPRSGAKGKPV